MQEYSYKNSGIEWLGIIPEHWGVTKVKKEFRVIPSNVDKKSRDDEEEVKLCNYVDVYYNDFITSRIDFMVATASKHEIKKFQLQIGDLLITKDSEDPYDIAVPALVKETEEKLLCGYHLSMIRTINQKIDGAFLFWSWKDDAIVSQLFREATGVTRWAIASRHIKNSTIAAPPLPEQKAIADYLDKACTRIDRIIAIKEEQLIKIKDIRKSKIDELVCFGYEPNPDICNTGLSYLPEIKKGWSTDRFRDVASIRIQKTDKKSELLDYIELEDIEQGTGNILGKRDTLEVESKVTLFYKGDVLFGKLRPYLEKYHYAEFDGKCTGEILAIRPNRINGKFLTYIVGSKWFIDLCNSMSYGAKMPRVNWNTQLAMVNIPIPSNEEQTKIVQQLDALSKKVELLANNIINQISSLQAYRKSLIHECVTGKKQVADLAPLQMQTAQNV